MLMPSTGRFLKKLLPIVLPSIILTACAANSLDTTQGTVTGYTSIGTVINPSARIIPRQLSCPVGDTYGVRVSW